MIVRDQVSSDDQTATVAPSIPFGPIVVAVGLVLLLGVWVMLDDSEPVAETRAPTTETVEISVAPRLVEPAPSTADIELTTRSLPVEWQEVVVPFGADVVRVMDDRLWTLDQGRLRSTADGDIWRRINLPGSLPGAQFEKGPSRTWLDVDVDGDVIVALAVDATNPAPTALDPPVDAPCLEPHEGPFTTALWRSLDLGTTWTRVDLATDPIARTSLLGRRHVALVDDARGDDGTVMVATYTPSPWTLAACLAESIGIEPDTMNLVGDVVFSGNSRVGLVDELFGEREAEVVRSSPSTQDAPAVIVEMIDPAGVRHEVDIADDDEGPDSNWPAITAFDGSSIMLVDDGMWTITVDEAGVRVASTSLVVGGPAGFGYPGVDDSTAVIDGSFVTSDAGRRWDQLGVGQFIHSYVATAGIEIELARLFGGRGNTAVYWSDGEAWFRDEAVESMLSPYLPASGASVGGRVVLLGTELRPDLALVRTVWMSSPLPDSS